MSNKRSKDDRRKIVKSLAVGTGAVITGKALPETWSKPLVDAVMLPAHAATTNDTGSTAVETTGATITTTVAPGTTGKPRTAYTVSCTYTPFGGLPDHAVSLQFRHLIEPDPVEDLTIRRTVYCNGVPDTVRPIDDYIKPAATDGKVISVISGPRVLGCDVGDTITVRVEIVETGAYGDCSAKVVFDHSD